MNSLLLLISLSCSVPQMINYTQYPWNKFDKQTLKRATKRCGKLYKTSPCVKYFIKMDKIDYRVVCGK